jgi:tetratricopeptide (TPR) repeat protein
MSREPIINRRLHSVVLGIVLTIGMAPIAVLAAEDATPAPAVRLIDRPPFDQLILKRGSGGEALDVEPLSLPQRPLAAVPVEGTLRVRLMDRPGEEFEVAWTDVASVRVYEELLLAEARRLTEAQDFDEAYDYFARLSAEYPALPGLKNAMSDYLRRNALGLYQAGQHDRALALLATLHQRDPDYGGLANAVQTVAGEIIQRYLREGNYSAARGVLELWLRQFPNLAKTAASDWQRRFEAAATRQLAEAERLIEQKQYVMARTAVQRALGIWPTHESAQKMLERIKREFPFVTVGVLETSPRHPVRRIDNWSALRSSRLVQRLLVEEVDFGADGGVYRSPFGELALDDTGRALSLTLSPATGSNTQGISGLSPDSLSRYLLSMAERGSPHYRSDFAKLLGGVSIAGDRVQLDLVRAHVRPESLLQYPPPSDTPDARAPGPGSEFAISEFTADQVVFAAAVSTRENNVAVQAVVEQRMSNDEAAVSALVAGDIEVLDRVPPWHIERLRGDEAVRVVNYRLPTVHVLIPNPASPLLVRREFRRALCFGIDRKTIVERVLAGGAALPGYEVLSGPFPAGLSLSDPVRYAYNGQVAPRAFEPRLAAILATIAWSNVQNPDGKGETPTADLPELVLAHPNDPVIRIACQSIEAQLERAGIPIQLREFSAEDLIAGRVQCDLRYAEMAVWEPATDARLIVGPGGLAGDIRNPYVETALAKLDAATNWNDVRTRLNELHEMVHHELPVIPLWQTANFFAYRASINGIGESPMTLYQNIEQWQLASGGDVAQLDRGD